jgi:CheY-like chemotaxis protein
VGLYPAKCFSSFLGFEEDNAYGLNYCGLSKLSFMKQGRLIILLIEDEDGDVLLLQRATQKTGHNLYPVHDGEEAICYLRGQGQYADRTRFPLPNVVLTDLKMPRMDGFGFLRWLRENPECSIIPIIVLSNSGIESDVREAYRLGANAYFRKPYEASQLIGMLRAAYDFWSRCECPPLSLDCSIEPIHY